MKNNPVLICFYIWSGTSSSIVHKKNIFGTQLNWNFLNFIKNNLNYSHIK